MELSGANRFMGGLKGTFDGHAHVFRVDLPMAAERRYTPKAPAPLATFAGLLRGEGLDGALLVQPSFLGTDNAQLLAALKQGGAWTDLAFRGVAVLSPEEPDWRDQLQRYDAAGVVGLRLNLVGRLEDLAAWRPLLAAVSDLGWHVELHCEGGRIPTLLPTLLDLCQILVIDHFGLPWPDQPLDCPGHRALLSAPPERLLVKVSAPYRVFPELTSRQAAERATPIFTSFLDRLGPDALLWGSDWPWTRFEGRHSYAEALSWRALWEGAEPTGAQQRSR